MRTQNNEYSRLRGKRSGFLSLFGNNASLWFGKDHLLSIKTRVYEEQYKRFDYKDIQAIIMNRDNHQLTWTFELVFLALLSATFSFWSMKLLIVPGLFFLLLYINWRRGPTCTCYLKTAVSREKFPSLNRLKNADDFITQLAPLIEKAQGSLSSEEVTLKLHELVQSKDSPDIPEKRPPAVYYNGNFHRALFYLMVLNGILTFIDFIYNALSLTAFEGLIASVLGIVLVISLVKQHEARMNQWIQLLTWTTLGYMIIAGFAFYLVTTYLTIQSKTVIFTAWDSMKMMSSISPHDNPILMVIYITSIIFFISAGITGFLLMRTCKNK